MAAALAGQPALDFTPLNYALLPYTHYITSISLQEDDVLDHNAVGATYYPYPGYTPYPGYGPPTTFYPTRTSIGVPPVTFPSTTTVAPPPTTVAHSPPTTIRGHG